MTATSAAVRPLGGPEGIVVFRVGAREVTVGEVVFAAHFRGALDAHWRDLLWKLACDEHASLHDLEPESEPLQARADQFRYERNLITAEETERWFEVRRLDQDDFSAHVSRGYWKEAIGGKISSGTESFAEAESGKRGLLTVELLLTGDFNRMERDFAWRLVALGSHDPAGESLKDRIEAERTRFYSRHQLESDGLPSWLETAGTDAAWFDEMLALEAAYGQRCETLLTPERLTRALRSQRLALMQFELEGIEFDTMATAREAVFCVREDGLSMEEVARESRYSYSRRDFVQEDLPEAWQVPLLSTPEGGLAGPFDDGELIHLFRLKRKIEPTIDDEAIRPRLEKRVLESAFAELCAQQGYKSLLAESGS